MLHAKFSEELHKQIKAFDDFWLDNQQLHGTEKFPQFMSREEWEDHFVVFIEHIYKEEE